MVEKKGAKKGKDVDSKPTSLRYTVFAVALVALLILPVINVGQGFDGGADITGQSIFETDQSYGNYFMSFFTGKGANLDYVISKYFLLFLIAVFVKSLLSVANFPPTDGNKATLYQWLMALPIAILSIIFITPEDLYGALNAYTALGLTLTIFIPFAVVIMYTVGSLTSKRKITAQNLILANFMWLLFAGFLIYRLFKLILVEGLGTTSALVIGISIAAAVIALLITWKFKTFSKWVVKTSGFGKELQSRIDVKDKEIANKVQSANKALQKLDEYYSRGGIKSAKESLKEIAGE